MSTTPAIEALQNRAMRFLNTVTKEQIQTMTILELQMLDIIKDIGPAVHGLNIENGN